MEWVHCNKCYTSPSPSCKFYFSSCGHLFCSKCVLNKDDCYVCNKKCNFMEINRSLKQEIQIFFRNPKDLLHQYWQNVKTVLEFQNFHRTRLQKYHSDKTNKALKYAKQAQVEVAKRSELEKSILVENKQLKTDLCTKSEHVQNLENITANLFRIAEKDKELIHLKQKLAKTKSKPFSSLNTNTPISTLSFLNCATSTPLNEDIQLFGEIENAPVLSGGGKMKDIFQLGDGNNFDSPISGCRGLLNTPAMLGLGNADSIRRSTSTNRSMRSFF